MASREDMKAWVVCALTTVTRLFFTLGYLALPAQVPAQTASLVTESQIQTASAIQFDQLNRSKVSAKDQAFASKVKCIANALVNAVPPDKQLPDTLWSAHVYEDPSTNVSTFPSGQIIINSGIGTVAKNQDELAAAISSPLASAVLQHAKKRILRDQDAQLRALASGQLPSQPYPMEKREAEITAQENIDADDLGRSIMVSAGFNPQGSLAVLESLANKQTNTRSAYQSRLAAARTWLERPSSSVRAQNKPC